MTYRPNLYWVLQISTIKINRSSSSYIATKEQNSQSKSLRSFHEIPGPKRLPVLGNLHLFSKFGPYSVEKLYDAYEDLHRKYGPIARLDLGQTIVTLFQPQDVQKLFLLEPKLPNRPLFEALRKHRLDPKRRDSYCSAGLVAENGKEWWRLRSKVNFMMKPEFSQRYLPQQAQIAEDFVQRIRKVRDSTGIVKDVLKELFRFTEEAIGLVCFGTRLGLLDADNSESVNLIQASDDTLSAMADTLLGVPWWKIFDTPTYKKLTNSQDFFHGFSVRCLEEAKRKSLLQEHDENLMFLNTLLEKFDVKDVTLLMTEIFSAGIDTTGSATAFLLYNLSRRPDVQDKLFKEIQTFAPNDKLLTLETLGSMKYLKACIKESHRLTPAVGGIARIFDFPTDFCGYSVPPNVLCLGVNPVISRQERNFRDPLSYRPERWLDESESKLIHPYCVMPFSHGVRRCVGQRFAENEMRLCAIKIIQSFKLEYDGPPIGSRMRLTLLPDSPIDLKFVERSAY